MRIRTIKPEFFTHAGLFDAEKETKLPLRVGFVGLWCACDREGRFKWEPRRLGVMILPYDGFDFSRVLDALVTRGFVVKYRVGDAWFGAVISFKTHQVINNRETASVLPDVSDAQEVEGTKTTRTPRVGDACPTPLTHAPVEGKGKEGNMERNIPPVAPIGGRERKAKSENIPTTPEAIKIAQLFHRRLTTAWDEKEIRAFKKLHPIDSEELALAISYTEAERAKGNEGRHRRDMVTFLNNFRGEVDRARQAPEQGTTNAPQPKGDRINQLPKGCRILGNEHSRN